MTTMDKAVSTEDLCANEFDPALSLGLGVARLEAVLHTLVENKVEALKNDNRKASSVHSSPKSILNRLRLTSTSSQSTKENEEEWVSNQKHRKKKKVDQCVVDMKRIDQKVLKREATTSSHGSRRYRCRIRSYEGSSNSEDERQRHYDNICVDNSCPVLNEKPPSCCCNKEIGGSIMHFDDDISLKIEGTFGDIETDAMISEDAIRRARRKRRRRRKRRMKKRLAMHHAHLVDPIEVSDSYKNLTEDELSRRAKWTIVATACLLLFMCMLLVGITLRMAPIIDEMVRKENEEFLNSLNRQRNSTVSSVHKNGT